MRKRWMGLTAILGLCLALGVRTAEAAADAPASAVDKLVGQPVDLAPWGYQARADRQVQEIPEADFFVAPDGKDSNPGTASAPFATLTRARDAVREKVRNGLAKDIVVQVRGGNYRQAETLTFGPEDSGTEKFSITYAARAGEQVVLSGGQRITGWKKAEGELWTAELPEVKAGKWYFRQLFVGGRRAVRARTPNIDAPNAWYRIQESPASNDSLPPADKPFDVKVTGPIQNYRNPGDVELVYIANNDGGRKHVGAVDETQCTLTLAPPHRWNARCFTCDWHLSIPASGKECYLENAREMLDQPGEWYLDRQTGILSYWPRPGEDLARDEVVAPMVQKTLLAVAGTAEQPVRKVRFRGLSIEYVDWPLPAWGYMGLFCCNVAVGEGPEPGHRFIEAAVDFTHARTCDFTDGRIAHVGGMGLCLRDGTAENVIEGNEVCDLGGGGIGAGGSNVAYGYLHAAPPPGPDEYRKYRIANNYIHHCGADYHGAAGICLYLSQDAVIAHNLIHDTPYFGMCVAGSQDLKVPFCKNNTVEYNDIHRAMQVTRDGAGLYVTFVHYDGGCLVRGNLIHDIKGRGGPCAGLYLDGGAGPDHRKGYHFVNNHIWEISHQGPLFFNANNPGQSTWFDNLFLKQGAPPPQMIEVLQGHAGLEPAYRRAILKTEVSAVDYYALAGNPGRNDAWSACQYNRPAMGDGVVEVFRHEAAEESARLKLRGLDAATPYELKVSLATAGEDLLAAMRPSAAEAVLPAGQTRWSGRQLMEEGLPIKTQRGEAVVITYQRVR